MKCVTNHSKGLQFGNGNSTIKQRNIEKCQKYRYKHSNKINKRRRVLHDIDNNDPEYEAQLSHANNIIEQQNAKIEELTIIVDEYKEKELDMKYEVNYFSNDDNNDSLYLNDELSYQSTHDSF